MRPRTKRLAWLVGAMAILIILPGLVPAVYAQGTPTPRPVTDNDVNRVSRNLYCPVCQNVPLEVCETEACARWRAQVRDLLAQGYTDDQVRQYFIERFGSKTVGTPTDPTSQLLTIALPFALIALIGVIIAFNLISWRRRHPRVQVEPESIGERASPDDYRSRLEAEIRKRD